jgi:hypothetical protein
MSETSNALAALKGKANAYPETSEAVRRRRLARLKPREGSFRRSRCMLGADSLSTFYYLLLIL